MKSSFFVSFIRQNGELYCLRSDIAFGNDIRCASLSYRGEQNISESNATTFALSKYIDMNEKM